MNSEVVKHIQSCLNEISGVKCGNIEKCLLSGGAHIEVEIYAVDTGTETRNIVSNILKTHFPKLKFRTLYFEMVN